MLVDSSGSSSVWSGPGEPGHRVSVVCVERPGKLAAEAEAEGATS